MTTRASPRQRQQPRIPIYQTSARDLCRRQQGTVRCTPTTIFASSNCHGTDQARGAGLSLTKVPSHREKGLPRAAFWESPQPWVAGTSEANPLRGPLTRRPLSARLHRRRAPRSHALVADARPMHVTRGTRGELVDGASRDRVVNEDDPPSLSADSFLSPGRVLRFHVRAGRRPSHTVSSNPFAAMLYTRSLPSRASIEPRDLAQGYLPNRNRF